MPFEPPRVGGQIDLSEVGSEDVRGARLGLRAALDLLAKEGSYNKPCFMSNPQRNTLWSSMACNLASHAPTEVSMEPDRKADPDTEIEYKITTGFYRRTSFATDEEGERPYWEAVENPDLATHFHMAVQFSNRVSVGIRPEG